MAACERQTYNLWMRETMVLNAAWMSAVVQVQTTGRWWFWSISERYWEENKRGMSRKQENWSLQYILLSEMYCLNHFSFFLNQLSFHNLNNSCFPNCYFQKLVKLFKKLILGFLTWPCQSDVLMRMMLSGRWLSDTRMWFSWSYTVFLGI